MSAVSPLVRANTDSLLALSRLARHVALHARRIPGVAPGGHRSSFRGRGMEYDHSRQYVPGDDIRNIDWRVTARTGRVHTKLFHEERERPVYLCVDFRAPMFFATRGRYKAVLASECAALLAWRAHQGGDRVGGLIFADTSHHEYRPGRGRPAVLRLIRHLVEHPAWDSPSGAASGDEIMERSLQRLLRVVHPGSLVFLISDFRHWSEACRRHLLALSRHNELLLLLVYDPLERALPPPGQYLLQDQHERLCLDTGDQALCARYARYFAGRRQALVQLARTPAIHYLECCTTDDPVQILRAERAERAA